MVRGLEDNDEIFKTEDDEMGHILRSYQLFESSGVGDTNYLLSGVSRNITACMNQLLTADYKEQEKTEAIQSIGPTKASGPDGFPAIVFQIFWHILGRDVSNFCLDVLNNGKSVDVLNCINIVLIPKNHHPKNPSDFRPISLCSVIYKIMSKSIANRFQKVLYCCIDQA
ncbi:hypothetical protein J1N35_006086 [Gossypium stocksii]|uniref:Reverse transcriptase n=1 Tax=Gossypium stocksii TaxID=47602 RepID=A0A9D3WG71_9ROSI|nr:hypothetical protein J1N35_006086 [Gossypium stocksii]